VSAVRLKFNMRAFVEIRNSPGVCAAIEAQAQRIAGAAGPGMEVKPTERHYGRQGRARVAVVTSTIDAVIAESQHRALSRAV
jgi:hypothetical protein